MGHIQALGQLRPQHQRLRRGRTEKRVLEHPGEGHDTRDHSHRGSPRLGVEDVLLLVFRQLDQHDHEEEQHHDAARIDQNLRHPEELGIHGEVAAGHAEHGEEESQDAVHGALGDHHEGGPGQGQEPEDREQVPAERFELMFHGMSFGCAEWGWFSPRPRCTCRRAMGRTCSGRGLSCPGRSLPGCRRRARTGGSG
ncbi:hypothetical protein GALL_483610 [mine drainage metagenome]|uniref:Uncharacterized protein n=1 Tax=mine drainage metagenome TaxID=410659 RepID=A0A1J5PFP8_9ZZZZ